MLPRYLFTTSYHSSTIILMTCLFVRLTVEELMPETMCLLISPHSQARALSHRFQIVRCPSSKSWRIWWGGSMIVAQLVKHLCFPLSNFFFVLTVDLFTVRAFTSCTHAPPQLIPNRSFNKASLKLWRTILEGSSYTKYEKFKIIIFKFLHFTGCTESQQIQFLPKFSSARSLLSFLFTKTQCPQISLGSPGGMVYFFFY